MHDRVRADHAIHRDLLLPSRMSIRTLRLNKNVCCSMPHVKQRVVRNFLRRFAHCSLARRCARANWLDSCYPPPSWFAWRIARFSPASSRSASWRSRSSPVTAPFTTCDLADFAQSHPADTGGHHPGRQMAVPHMRADRSHRHDGAHSVPQACRSTCPIASMPQAPTTSFAYTRRDLLSVLRL